MDSAMQRYFENSRSNDKDLKYEAYNQIIAATNKRVDWAYEVWDQLKADLLNNDNHQRSRAAQYLANLAKSDPANRMLEDFPTLWEVTYDKKFVTARHTLQSIWKVALAGNEQKEMMINCFTDRFVNSVSEKNYTLVRFDIIQGLRNIYDELNDEKIKQIAFDLIAKEEDPKYKKKYAKVWKHV